MNNQKQMKAIEFLACMEELALEKEMKQRILDRIRELKSSLQGKLGELELGKKMLEVDELAIYMKKQFIPEEQKEFAVDNITTVSIDEVREQVEQILQECHVANESEKNIYVYNQQSFILEASQRMRDLANVNYKEMQNARFFCEKFEQIGNHFNCQISSSMTQFTKTVFQNCDQATAGIKNMLAYIQDERLHKNQQELYYAYGTRRNQILLQHTAEGDAWECGGSLIRDFAVKHVRKVKRIIEKQKKKTLFIKLLPLLIVLTLSIAPKVGDWIGEQIETIVGSEEETNLNENVTEFASKGTDYLIEKFTEAGSDFAFSVGISVFGYVGLPLIIIVAVLYYAYIKKVNRTHAEKICAKVGAYLVPEIETFLKEEALYKKVKEAFDAQEEALETSYREVFEKLLSNETLMGIQVTGEQERFLSLYREWNSVKRLA